MAGLIYLHAPLEIRHQETRADNCGRTVSPVVVCYNDGSTWDKMYPILLRCGWNVQEREMLHKEGEVVG